MLEYHCFKQFLKPDIKYQILHLLKKPGYPREKLGLLCFSVPGSRLLRSSLAVRPLSQTFLVYEDLDSVEEDGRGHCRTRSIGVRLLFLTIRLG